MYTIRTNVSQNKSSYQKRRIVTHRNAQQTTASSLQVVVSCHAIMTARATNGCTSGRSSLRLGASTSRQQVGTRERTRHTSLLGRYVICFARTSQPHRKPAFCYQYPSSSIRIFYTSLLYESSSPNPTLKDIKLT